MAIVAEILQVLVKVPHSIHGPCIFDLPRVRLVDSDIGLACAFDPKSPTFGPMCPAQSVSHMIGFHFGSGWEIVCSSWW